MANKFDDMTNEQLCILYQETNDESVFEYCKERNQGLTEVLLEKYIRLMPTEEDDLRQNAAIEFWNTMKSFDITKGFKLTTWYTILIKKAVNNIIRSRRTIRLPANILANLSKAYEDDPTLIVACGSLDSIAHVSDSDGHVSTLGDLIADEFAEQLVYKQYSDEAVLSLLSTLKPREEVVIKAWLGYGEEQPLLLSAIARRYSVSRERIRQIIVRAIKKLRPYAHLYLDAPEYSDLSEWDSKHVYTTMGLAREKILLQKRKRNRNN